MPKHQTAGTGTVLNHMKASLKKLNQTSKSGEEYIDLMLIHAPWGGPKGRASNWKALKQAQEEGWIKDIGVSNL